MLTLHKASIIAAVLAVAFSGQALAGGKGGGGGGTHNAGATSHGTTVSPGNTATGRITNIRNNASNITAAVRPPM